jgi:hypothetical protein
MRNAVFAITVLLVCPALLSAQEQKDAFPGNLTVYFPEGTGTATLEGENPLDLRSGGAVSCPPGAYRLQITHPDYEPFEQIIAIRSGAEVILLPEMALSRQYRVGQAEALLAQKEKVLRARRRFLTAAIVNGALSLVSAGIVGGLEWNLASRKDALAAEYDRYRTASAADAPGIWEDILGIKAGIDDLRLYETIALSSASGFALAGTVLFFLKPSTELLDLQIGKLKNSENE